MAMAGDQASHEVHNAHKSGLLESMLNAAVKSA